MGLCYASWTMYSCSPQGAGVGTGGGLPVWPFFHLLFFLLFLLFSYFLSPFYIIFFYLYSSSSFFVSSSYHFCINKPYAVRPKTRLQHAQDFRTIHLSIITYHINLRDKISRIKPLKTTSSTVQNLQEQEYHWSVYPTHRPWTKKSWFFSPVRPCVFYPLLSPQPWPVTASQPANQPLQVTQDEGWCTRQSDNPANLCHYNSWYCYNALLRVFMQPLTTVLRALSDFTGNTMRYKKRERKKEQDFPSRPEPFMKVCIKGFSTKLFVQIK